MSTQGGGTVEETRWYKDAIVYELNVRAFFDSNNDGVGDLVGVIQKLDYLKELGVTTLWMLPFFPSPFRDGGYDISDYYSVDPKLGTLEDFKQLIKEAHEREIKIIIELVLNHTSDQHEWFQKSRTSPPGSEWRELYVWSETPKKYEEARIIFKDFETSNWTYDEVAKAYYWHRFYSHQPDLNYDSALTREKMLNVVTYWLELGVDGLRLDAVPYLFERDGTNCENLPETHDFLKKLRASVDGQFTNKMLLAEANQWPEDAIEYFGDGDECHMAFHFALMPRMFMSIEMEDRHPVMEILNQTPPIPESCQWALFLRNHDELTLEMVTDEERDYMYSAYSRDRKGRLNLGIRLRLAHLMGNDRRKIELMNVLLFSLPGTPVIYYGDEILMGDIATLGDRDGVRTPMQWSSRKNGGFSKASKKKLFLPLVEDPEYRYDLVNVETEQRNLSSHLWWMKRLIAIRNRFKAFGRGGIRFLEPSNTSVLAFVRQYQSEEILVAVNLSKFPQIAELDLRNSQGQTLHDIFGGTQFPQTRGKLTLSFGPFGYYVFSMFAVGATTLPPLPTKYNLKLERESFELRDGYARTKLEMEILPSFMVLQPWFRGKGRSIDFLKIRDVLPVKSSGDSNCQIMITDVYFSSGLPEAYALPVSYAFGETAKQINDHFQAAVISKVAIGEKEGVMFDGMFDTEFHMGLLEILSKGTVKKRNGLVSSGLRDNEAVSLETPRERVAMPEQSGSRAKLDSKLILKFQRYLFEGPNSELQISDFLTAKSFAHIRPTFGNIRYAEQGSEHVLLAMFRKHVPIEENLWNLSVNEAMKFLQVAITRKLDQFLPFSFFEMQRAGTPEDLKSIIDRNYLEMLEKLGKTTAEFHLALSQNNGNSDFAVVPFSYLYQASLSYSMIVHARRSIQFSKSERNFDERTTTELKDIQSSEALIVERFKSIRSAKIDASRILIHGNYSLDEVYVSGNDLIITWDAAGSDTCGRETLVKRSPLNDVADMLRSIHHAAFTGLGNMGKDAPNGLNGLVDWAHVWYKICSSVFLKSYFDALGDSELLPGNEETRDDLLAAILLDKCLNELEYELSHGTQLIQAALLGIKELLIEDEAIVNRARLGPQT